MQPIVVDIEADGLNASTIHCLSADLPGKGIKTTHSYEDMRKFIQRDNIVVGHNFIRYDKPTLERLIGVKFGGFVVDTLALSWYLSPDRNRHGLESYGEEFGIAKPEIDDWSNLTPEEYAYRCEEDVKINRKLWDKQWKQLVRLYEGEEEAWRFIRYLSFKMDCAALQEESGWKLDLDLCMKSLAMLRDERDYKVGKLAEAMPKVPKYVERRPPKKPYKQDQTLSESGKKWFSLLEEQGLPEDYKDSVYIISHYEEPKPTSHIQIKKWLYDMGWVPQNFEYKRNKETNEIRKIPQIKNEDGDGVCESIKKLYKKEPSLELLDGLSVLNHRIPLLKGFLDNVDDEGYIQAQVQGLTNTLRFKHKIVVNLPGVDKPYGDIIRACLIAPEGYELCGSDMSGLEDRTKHHYMWEHDPEYVKQMLAPDYDPHLDLGVLAGMMTQKDADLYKEGDPDFKKKLKPIRHDAKQVNYSCTYGVTPQGLVRNTGMSLTKATKLHETYWKRNWSIQAIADGCTVKKSGGTKWLFNPVSKFWYSLRHDKDRFSTLNQGTGVFVFDTWIGFILEKRRQLTAQMHDEIILTIKGGNRDKCTKLLNWAIDRTNESLKLNRDMGIDIQFGDNYASIH